MKRLPALTLVTLLLLLGAACNDDNKPEPVPTVTETFDGDLALGESSCHFFDVTQPGPVTMSITALAPLETLTLGLGIGLPDDTAETGCGLTVTDTSVRKDESFLASVSLVGQHCVCIFDVGNIFVDQTVTYTLDVDHP